MRNLQLISLLFLGLLLTLNSNGQNYEFSTFSQSDGLPDQFIYSLAQGHNGYIWIGTGEALVRYDGRNFISFTEDDSLAENHVSSLFVSDDVLWIGHREGHVSYMKAGRFHKINTPDNPQPINDFCRDTKGNIFYVVQEGGLHKIENGVALQYTYDWKKLGRRTPRFYSVHCIGPREFLLGSSRGLLIAWLSEGNEIDSVSFVDQIPQTKINRILPCKGREGKFWIACDYEGFYQYSHSDGSADHMVGKELIRNLNLDQESIQDIQEDNEGHLLLAVIGRGVIKLEYDSLQNDFTKIHTLSTKSGMKENNIRRILLDQEGNYWFASFSQGVFSMTQDHFIFYNLDDIDLEEQKVLTVLNTGEDLWMGMDRGLIRTDPGNFTSYNIYYGTHGLPEDAITVIYQQDNGVLWVGTRKTGIFYKEPGGLRFESYFYSSASLKKQVTAINGTGDLLYVGTMDGLFILDTEKHSRESLSMREGLLHNNINFIFKDKQGTIWVGTKNSGIARIDENNGVRQFKIDSYQQINITDMTEDLDGNLWLASNTSGIYKLMVHHDSIVNISARNGLKKNYCYCIECDKNNIIWIGHHPGISSINASSMKLEIFSQDDILEHEFSHFSRDDEGSLWFASENGLIRYIPDRDRLNNTPPMLNFTSIQVDDIEHDLSTPIKLGYPYRRPKYNIRIGFTGISYEDPLGVQFEYLLNELHIRSDDQEWRKLGNTNFKEFNRIAAGEYEFLVRAYNSDGIQSENPISMKFTIASPFWQKGWFYMLLIVILGILVYLLMEYRERKLKQQKQNLQKEVEAQTHLLSQQKGEIERKNKDITASINYAEKIQKAILPEISILKSIIPDSFVFFKPRNIVSGDFFWFKQSGDYLVLCCADCTGHGVPGAFMSMIGTTILNDIFKMPEISSPADMLEHLDSEIKLLLQSSAESVMKDGMDISILKLHLSSRRAVLASARRPVYLILNGELTIFDGTRRSIGDTIMEKNSTFKNSEYQCSTGDSIFLFSDGYPDQFGGPLGKKILSKGMKELIDDIKNLPAEKQLAVTEDYYDSWKGELDQVDDVLFIGLRL